MAAPNETASAIKFHDFGPPEESFRDAVLNGLEMTPKSIPSKFIYDEEGSRLFDIIPTVPEYYQARTEKALLTAHGLEIAAIVGPNSYVVDYGSGSSVKSRILMDALTTPAAFVPLDISGDYLRTAAETFAADYPDIAVHAVCADFLGSFELPHIPTAAGGRRLGFFPGSTIGNFTHSEASGFMARARQMLAGGALLIGVDLKKEVAVLEAAYNDAQGVSAAFNLNLLSRINRELDGDIDVAAYRHHAVYRPEFGRVDIGIQSLRDQAFTVLGRRFEMRRNDVLHTQHANKYTIDEFRDFAVNAGFTVSRVWSDDDDLYALFYLDAR
ncbi:MAG: L-histidine N(alpha)-methyltransferase [Alphaproteobacteria bacterium]